MGPRRVTQYTLLLLVSHYSTDWQLVAVTHKKAQQGTNKGSEEEDYKLANLDVNNAGFKKTGFANVL